MDFLSLHGNWVDLVIISFLAIYILERFHKGFTNGVIDLAGLLLSFLFALRFYSLTGKLLIANFTLPRGIANALAFFITATIGETIYFFLSSYISSFILKEFAKSKLNRILGFVPPLISGLILVAFFIITILTLPVRPNIKQEVLSSKIGGYIAHQTLGLERIISEVLGGAVQDALTFLTVKPQGEESINLNFKTIDYTVDTESEEKMLNLLNQERNLRSIKVLRSNNSLKEVARSHCKDMFTRGYFSHYTPDGLSPFDRMNSAHIQYQTAGENLAYAPTVDIAHTGLMNSPGHRANILTKDFGKAGIGVINAGIYGRMFCQEFSD